MGLTHQGGLKEIMMETNIIYNEDCLVGMKGLPNESIDLVITSPPFNLGNVHSTGNFRHRPYRDDMVESEYQDWQVSIINECYRILRKNGSMFYHHKNRIKNKIVITPYEWLLKTKFFVKQELVWFNRSQNFNKCRFYPMTERIYWLSKTGDTMFFNHINHHDLFQWKAEGTKKKHTRTYPEKLVEDILNCFEEANIVIDPFMGSGTTAVVCRKLGRHYIGFEISKEYCKIAKQRLEAEKTLWD